MRIDVFRYLQEKLSPTLYIREVAARALKRKNNVRVVDHDHDMYKAPGKIIENDVKPDHSAKRYSLSRLLLVLVVSILMSGLLKDYVFHWFSRLHSSDMPFIGSVVLIAILSPALYAFIYRPIIMQFDQVKKAENLMRELAFVDVLTGIYNRRGFLTYANHLLKLSNRTQRGLILIYADLDNMKQINDQFGHEEGDRALATIADVLKRTFRVSDVIGRVGGDEFAILAIEAKAESLDALRKRLNENLKNSQACANPIHQLTFSLGIIYYNPEKPQGIEELLKKADMVMYKDKSYKTAFCSCEYRNTL